MCEVGRVVAPVSLPACEVRSGLSFLIPEPLGVVLMSEPLHAAAAHQDPEPGQLFSNAELREFEADDTEAGRRIAKLLTGFFIYTVIAMSVSIAWSVVVISH